jgi:TPR repeat protein
MCGKLKVQRIIVSGVAQRQDRIAGFCCALIFCSAVAFVGGCGEGAISPSSVQPVENSLLAIKLAALAKKADADDAGAQNDMAVVLAHGEGGGKDVAKAIEWWQKAATQGSADAQYNLGLTYALGNGVQVDVVKALHGYRAAAAQGHPGAQNNLGVIYAEGSFVGKDAVAATAWWKKAAAQGYADAQYNLGVMYRDGEGIPADQVLAYAWFNLAAASGHGLAIENGGIADRVLSQKEFSEAQRLASGWKNGQVLAREKKGTGAVLSAGNDNSRNKAIPAVFGSAP